MSVKVDIKTRIKSIWVTPWENETGAPEKRIIHGRYIKLSRPADNIRIGVRLGEGYFKCGSENAVDWITEFAAYVWEKGDWHRILHKTGLEKPGNAGDAQWFDLPKISQAFFLEVRRSGIDSWWPCYNIANTGFVIEANGSDGGFDSPKRRLHRVICEPDTSVLSKEDIYVTRTSTAIRYQSPYYSAGFRLKSAGLDFLGLNGAGTGKTFENILAMGAMLVSGDNDFYTQGPIINPVSSPSVCGFFSYDVKGETEVRGNTLIYSMSHEETELNTELKFTMKKNSIHLDIKRRAAKTIKLLDSSPFRIAFNSRCAPLTALGSVVKEGETGTLSLPLTLHLPGYAGIRLEGCGSVRGHFNSIRPEHINTFGLELGEKLCEDGCYLIEKGEYSGSVTMTVGFDHHIELAEDVPEHILAAVGRYVYSSLPYRADTATFSNNGNSMGSPICIDVWGDMCKEIGKGPYGIDSFEFMKNTIETHLLGAPAYAAGLHFSGKYSYEDEYLMTGTAILLGIAQYMENAGTKGWYEQFKEQITQKIIAMKIRDIDGDGLVESTVRKGIYGEHQWSTCWYDVISYGYKDAFSNAQLYPALLILGRKIAEYSDNALSHEIAVWAQHIKSVYCDTFMTENGWLAGWKCKEGRLHDYGFLAVNGAAVSYGLLEGGQAVSAMAKLWANLEESGFDSFDMGLPGNIYCIDNGDMAAPQHRLPFGGYMNGGVTLSQARHFINGLYTIGMNKEADFVLSEICKGLVNGNVIGGVDSGVDWKTWDGVASGYEGMLGDQLGIFQPLIRRYRRK